VTKILGEQGKIEEEIEGQIKEFGFSDEQLSYFFKAE